VKVLCLKVVTSDKYPEPGIPDAVGAIRWIARAGFTSVFLAGDPTVRPYETNFSEVAIFHSRGEFKMEPTRNQIMAFRVRLDP